MRAILPIFVAASALVAPVRAARATDVTVAGLFPGKAVLVINGAAPRTMSVGGKPAEGVRVLAVDAESATLEIDGRRERLMLGQASSARREDPNAQAVLTADATGHFFVNGTVNGSGVRFLVDTGATTIALSQTDARRAGVDYQAAQRGVTQTANGTAAVWLVKLNSVRVGDIELHNVDATVLSADLPVALLGGSFLNRMEMRRDGDSMVLRKRF
ncbi:MAG: TIGR02281 family clan AA aspartic protease [Rhodocyclaceae bacterium]|nr:TIGR02281 family clan AA aspartic protease [Rhodocyclaceae bacterium]MBX3669392.1 TIGR02281 family clan AA aspartic protease [Rhodocyclaceae bacterium]